MRLDCNRLNITGDEITLNQRLHWMKWMRVEQIKLDQITLEKKRCDETE